MLHLHHKTYAGVEGEIMLVLRWHAVQQWEYQQDSKPWFIESWQDVKSYVLERRASSRICYSDDFQEVKIGFIDWEAGLTSKGSRVMKITENTQWLFCPLWRKKPYDLWSQFKPNTVSQDTCIERKSQWFLVLLRGRWGLQRPLSSTRVCRNIKYDISVLRL